LPRFDRAKEVLLVFPGKYNSPNPQVPLSLLHLASFLIKSGYCVRIMDMRLENLNKFKIGKPLFVGISSIHGSQIRYGLEFARQVRSSDSSIPIVWGGIHPTLLPEQTAANEFVDVVVRGEGEQTLQELADKFWTNKSIDEVKGITFKSMGTIKNTPDRELMDLDKIPINLPFDLLSLEKYPTLRAGRFHIQTSRGCPHKCGFCYNTVYNKRLWRGKSAHRVVDEIAYILEKFPQVKIIDPIDDNFFVDQKRVEDICQEILNRKIKVSWRANCRFDYMSTYGKDFIELLAKSGCSEIDFGGETASERLQSFINKDVTTEQIIRSVENLKKWAPSIEPFVSWMSGLPTETEDDLMETCDLMDRMSEVNPKTQHYGVFLFTPFPSPILDSLGPEFKPPQSFGEWGKGEVFHFKPPWHSKQYVSKLQDVSTVSIYAFYPRARVSERRFYYRLGYGLLNKIAKYRWKHRYFRYPVELKLASVALRKRREYL
jgi:anaerobic magnesium-protoporphyrin IX monomethyl ester cyclase